MSILMGPEFLLPFHHPIIPRQTPAQTWLCASIPVVMCSHRKLAAAATVDTSSTFYNYLKTDRLLAICSGL